MSNYNILIIEDNFYEKELYKNLLKHERVNLTFTRLGEVVTKAIDTQPHIILCDAEEIEKDCSHIAKNVKNHPKLAEIPFIVISYRDLSVTYMKDKFIDGYIKKPFQEPERFIQEVSKYIKVNAFN